MNDPNSKVKVIAYILPGGQKVVATPEAWLVAIISELPPATLQKVCAKLEAMQKPGANGIYKGTDLPLSLTR